MDVFDNFGSLDDLIQVIYHSTGCFILISNVNMTSWSLELGLVNGEGCWWRGTWDKNDVYKFAGSKVTDRALESFSEKIAQYIIAGELAIVGWSEDESNDLQLKINPTGKTPVTVELIQLSAKEGAPKAMNILKGIALQAQSRQCRLHPSALPLSNSTGTAKDVEKVASSSVKKGTDEELRSAQERIKRLEGEVNSAKQAMLLEKDVPATKHMPPKPPPGASRANPTKKRRKIIEAGFEDE